MSQTVYDRLREQIRSAKQEQNDSYEKIVMDKIMSGATSEEIAIAHEEYVESLGMFDVAAFEKVIDHIINNEDDKVVDSFASSFQYVSDYITQRNNWSEKRLDAINSDGDVASRQATFDMMDRNRTRAHNGVISLYNRMNEYAQENGLTVPYPTPYGEFKPHIPDHREDVAQILTRNTPLMEISNSFVSEAFQERGFEETTVDKLKAMSLSELYEYAQKASLKKSVDELTESAQEEGLAH